MKPQTTDISRLETWIHEHATPGTEHAELFARVAPEAFQAQARAWDEMVQANAARRRYWDALEPTREDDRVEADQPDQPRIDPHRPHGVQGAESTVVPPIREDSHVAQAMTLQPVRDVFLDGFIVLSEDRKLDVLGARYPNVWTEKSGNAFPALQKVWADANDGSFGFDHEVRGTVTGQQANSGAGIFVQFKPSIAPGLAQVRPYAPYIYQWSSISFKSREENRASFGVRVWSWDLAGGDFTMEQDYRYPLWENTIIANYFGVANSPSWIQNGAIIGPGWDDDHAFLFGAEAPYFKTRANRVYMAAVWCFGTCWSVSRQNRPGAAIGRLHAKVPFVVIGYQ